jgi:hypothetical protein
LRHTEAEPKVYLRRRMASRPSVKSNRVLGTTS